jgi:SAM-dependent methyltransferase
MNMPEPPSQREVPADWGSFYRYTQGREVRPLFDKGMAAAAAANIRPGDAVEIGFGDGEESVALLQAGWRVTAIDPTPEAADLLRQKAPAGLQERLEIITSPAEKAALPAFDLLYSGFSLPFIDPQAFPVVWESIRERLRPGGLLVVNVFGVRDAWAGAPGVTFLDRAAAAALVDGLELIALDETDEDGPSASGPKHWHIFDLIARHPRAAGG